MSTTGMFRFKNDVFGSTGPPDNILVQDSFQVITYTYRRGKEISSLGKYDIPCGIEGCPAMSEKSDEPKTSK